MSGGLINSTIPFMLMNKAFNKIHCWFIVSMIDMMKGWNLTVDSMNSITNNVILRKWVQMMSSLSEFRILKLFAGIKGPPLTREEISHHINHPTWDLILSNQHLDFLIYKHKTNGLNNIKSKILFHAYERYRYLFDLIFFMHDQHDRKSNPMVGLLKFDLEQCNLRDGDKKPHDIDGRTLRAYVGKEVFP